jgi:hypothetical protein
MVRFGPILKTLAAFGCGAAVAAVFLRAPIESSTATTGTAPQPATASAPAIATTEPQRVEAPRGPVRTITIDQNARQQIDTTGSAPSSQAASPQQAAPARPPSPQARAAQAAPAEGRAGGTSAPSCDVAACSRAYHSFDSATCTYRSYSGERKQCQK